MFIETLRKYPVTTILTRQAMESYTFSGNQITIPKDTRVWVPVYGIHRDPKIYPNPETFDPNRFDDENIKERHPSYYLPFGAGPRNCLGNNKITLHTYNRVIQVMHNFVNRGTFWYLSD